jgi:hypothetical protein
MTLVVAFKVPVTLATYVTARGGAWGGRDAAPSGSELQHVLALVLVYEVLLAVPIYWRRKYAERFRQTVRASALISVLYTMDVVLFVIIGLPLVLLAAYFCCGLLILSQGKMGW